MKKSELLSDLSTMINARSEGVRLLLKQSGVFLPDNENPSLVKVYEAAKKDASFMKKLYQLKNNNLKLNADGGTVWSWIGNILSGVGDGIAKSSTTGSVSGLTDAEIIQAQLLREQQEEKEKETEKKEALKWVAIGVGLLLVVVVAVVIIKKARR